MCSRSPGCQVWYEWQGKESLSLSVFLLKIAKYLLPAFLSPKKGGSIWQKLFLWKKVLSWFQALECRKFSYLLPWVSDIEIRHPWSSILISHPCLPDFVMPLLAQVNLHIWIQTRVLLSTGLKTQERSCRDVRPTTCMLMVHRFPVLQHMRDWWLQVKNFQI